MHPAQLISGGQSGAGGAALTITFSANATDVNLKTALEAIYGTISSPVNVVATQNAGVTFSNSGGSAPAFSTGALPVGSTVRLNFYGKSRGKGGKGGGGGDYNANGRKGGNGNDGSAAWSLGVPVTIDLGTTGNIYGGGGGGGGGGATSSAGGNLGGGGGGGGQGDVGGGGGSAGTGQSDNGDAGSSGSPSNWGGGGSGALAGSSVGDGSRGGGWGSSGNDGNGGGSGGGSKGTGGAGGNAITTNGHAITWIAGNNTTQVKGSVS
jgi:hypothetical protein